MPHRTHKHSYDGEQSIDFSSLRQPAKNPEKNAIDELGLELGPLGERGEQSFSVHKNRENVQGENEQYSSIQKKEMERWERRSIYKLPRRITNLNDKAYRPQVVSFGPYHNGDKDLKSMEEHKERVLQHFLQRSGKTMEKYKDSLLTVVQDLKDAYDSLDTSLKKDSEAFLQLMIRDGIFMLEILIFSTSTGTRDYPPNDPIFSNHGRLQSIPYIKQDMLKIENQLPMLLLRKLLEVKDGKVQVHGEEEINKLVFRFCFRDRTIPRKHIGKCHHVLHLYRKVLLELEQPKPNSEILHDDEFQDEVMRPVTELREAGIRFRRSQTKSLKDIAFDNGFLKLPAITVDDTTEPLFLNLMAFERYHVGIGNEVSSYVVFMDNIVDNAKDISILRRKNIVQNSYGSDEAAAKLFNSLSKDVMMDQYGSLSGVHKMVNEHCNKLLPKWRAAFCFTYCRNPWTGVSVLAAIVLFVLTFCQTMFAVMDFYKK